MTSPPDADAPGAAAAVGRWWRHPVATYGAAGALYLAVSLALWWRLLAGGLATSLPSGSADPGQEVWFLGWFEHALATGTNPFFSRAVFAPSGVNLLSNTSCDLLGLLFSPITATAGPVAALNVAILLAPVASGLGAFALCRRYVRWVPGAFGGGLLFAFGPFLATDLRYGHIDLTWLVLPPLIWCCIDALVLRGTGRPVAVGTALGILVVAQFFVSTEILAVTALLVVVALALAAAARRRLIAPAVRAAWRGLAVALGLAGTLLAYPLWMVLAGPRHVSGPVWPHIGDIATSVAATVQPHAELRGVAFISGGNGGYLGVALLLVLVAGAVWCRRRDAVRLAGAVGVVALLASLGYRLHLHHGASSIPLPAVVLGHIALLDSIVPARFAAGVDLCAAVILAVTVERLATAVDTRRRRTGIDTWRRPAGVLAGAVCAVALVPLVVVPRWPYPVRSESQPAVISRLGAGPRPASAPVIAIYPDAPDAVADQMTWQAEDDFTFSLADGYAVIPGPDGRSVATQSPPVDALWLVLAAGSAGRLHLPLTATTVRSVWTSLRQLEVRTVVVLPGAAGSATVRRALTQVLGPPTLIASTGAAGWALGAEPSGPGLGGRTGRLGQASLRMKVANPSAPITAT